MKAGVYHGPGDVRVEDIEIPVISNPDDVLVRVANCGICGSDLHRYVVDLSKFQERPPWTRRAVLGHELSGTVEDIGDGVTGLEEGMVVTVVPYWGCGNCPQCRAGEYQRCADQQMLFRPPNTGGFAEYVVLPASQVYPLPDSMTLEHGAMMDCLACGVHAARLGEAGPSDRVLVIGAGVIGLSAIAVLAGRVDKIYACDLVPKRLEIAREFGADDAFPVDGELSGRLGEVTDGLGPDLVIEAVGGEAPTAQLSFDLAARGGRVVLQGISHHPIPIRPMSIVSRELTVRGGQMYSTWAMRDEFQMAIDMAAEGRADISRLVTHRYPLEKIGEAFEMAAHGDRGEVFKVIVQI